MDRIRITSLVAADAEAYQTLRLRALLDHPEAFGSAHEDELSTPLEGVAERLVATVQRFTLGAWQDDTLVGTVGFYQNSGRKTRHRGGVWGMYVAPEARGQGVGAALLRELLQRAKGLPGLEEIILAVTIGNAAARKIYTGAGFELSHIERRYLKIEEKYYDLEWMTLTLGAQPEQITKGR